jgi:hypothetical protein
MLDSEDNGVEGGKLGTYEGTQAVLPLRIVGFEIQGTKDLQCRSGTKRVK